MPPASLRALSLYRALLREARQMPTPNRRRFIQLRAREGFEAGRAAGGSELQQLLALAEAQLESAQVQRQLLTGLAATGNLKGPK